MAERAIFLDRDNTIIENDGYLGDPSKVKLLPGAGTAIAALRRLGYKIIVVSNQSGVARGMFTEADVEAVNQEMCRQLKEQAGATIDASYYCPYHPEAKIAEYRADHDWRKPKGGMLKQAAEDFRLDLAQSWMIGDQPRDIAAGAVVGCRTVLLRDPDHMGTDTDPGAGSTGVSPNFIVRTLADAARVVSREGRGHVRPAPESAKEPPAESTPSGVPESTGTQQAADAVGIGTAPAGRAPIQPHRVDEAAIAARVADVVVRAMPAGGRTDKLLEELVTQLRHQHRQQEYQPEFSLATFGAVLLQFATVCMVIIGVVSTLGSGSITDAVKQLIAVQRAGIWVMVGLGCQMGVIALMLVGRRK